MQKIRNILQQNRYLNATEKFLSGHWNENIVPKFYKSNVLWTASKILTWRGGVGVAGGSFLFSVPIQILGKHQVFFSIPFTIFIACFKIFSKRSSSFWKCSTPKYKPHCSWASAEPPEQILTEDTFLSVCLCKLCFYCQSTALQIHCQLATHHSESPPENNVSIWAD